MCLLLHRVRFFHTSVFSLDVGHFSESALGFPVAFPILFPFCSGRIESTCFSSLTYPNKRNISFVSKLFHHLALAWVCFGFGFLVCERLHKTAVLKCGPWPTASVSLSNLLQIFSPISDLLNQKVWVLGPAICV